MRYGKRSDRQAAGVKAAARKKTLNSLQGPVLNSLCCARGLAQRELER